MVKALLQDLVGRGLVTDRPMLFVIDGSRALRKNWHTTRSQCPRDDAGTGGGFKNASRQKSNRALRDEPRIWLEQERTHVAVMKRGSRPSRRAAA